MHHMLQVFSSSAQYNSVLATSNFIILLLEQNISALPVQSLILIPDELLSWCSLAIEQCALLFISSSLEVLCLCFKLKKKKMCLCSIVLFDSCQKYKYLPISGFKDCDMVLGTIWGIEFFFNVRFHLQYDFFF